MTDKPHELPPEPAGGQDDERPDTLLAVRATITLLSDIAAGNGLLTDDHMLRLLALRSALRRLRSALEHDAEREQR